MLVTELLEKGKEYGREFILLIIILSAAGLGLKVVWESTNTRLTIQDARIETSEKFIREELMDLNQQTLEVTRQSTAVTNKATEVMSRAIDSLDRNTAALQSNQP